MPARVIREYIATVRDAGRNARLYLAGLFLLGLGQSIFSLLFNLYLRELGLGDAVIGQVLSKVSLGAAVATLPMAFLFHRWATRRILIASGVLLGFSYLLQGALSTPELLLLAAFFSGTVAATFRLSIAPVVMREVAAEARPYLFSASFTVLFLSAIAGSGIGGALPHLFHWITPVERLALRWSLWAACLVTAAAALPFSLMRGAVASAPDAHDRGEAPPERARWLQGPALALEQLRFLVEIDWGLQLKLALPAFLIGLGAGLIIPFLNLYFRDRFGLDPVAIGALFMVMQGFMVVGNLFGPAVSKRLGLVGGVVATQLASVPFMVVLAVSGSLPLVFAAFCLRGALMNMNQPLTSHFAMEMVPKAGHTITNSLLSLAWYVSWSISADIGGALIERKGYGEPLLIAAGLYVLASLLYWAFFRNVEEGRVPRGEVEIPEA
jgi:predicted MFS family arabinose efflux permease